MVARCTATSRLSSVAALPTVHTASLETPRLLWSSLNEIRLAPSRFNMMCLLAAPVRAHLARVRTRVRVGVRVRVRARAIVRVGVGVRVRIRARGEVVGVGLAGRARRVCIVLAFWSMAPSKGSGEAFRVQVDVRAHRRANVREEDKRADHEREVHLQHTYMCTTYSLYIREHTR